MKRCMLLAVAVALAAPAVVAQTFNNIGLPDENVAPGAVVLAQVVQFTVATGDKVTITKVRVENTADTPVVGAEVEYIEVRRNSETGPVLKKQTTNLADFADEDGIEFDTVTTASIREFTAGTHRLYILIKLKAGTTLGREIELGNTKITAGTTPPTPLVTALVPVTYPPDEATFTVRLPEVAFDASVPDADVYRGQRFLAARVLVDATDLPFETTISQVVLKNVALGGTKLTGAYVDKIEVRRASDDAQLGSTNQAAALTTTGVVITTSNAKAGPYSALHLEIWVTLKLTAPMGHKLQLAADVRCGGRDIPADGEAPTFTVKEPTGFEKVENHDLAGGRVFSNQRFLAQRIEVGDDDLDPYDVTVNSLVVWNIAAESPLADDHIVRIEIIRARDGALMGSVTSASGLRSGGVRIATGSNNVVADDTSEVIELWVTLGPAVPLDRKVQLQTVVWHTEDSKIFGKPQAPDTPLEGPEFITGPAGGQGFETETAMTLPNRTVFQGVRFLAQRLQLKDNDDDPYDVIINSLMIRNVATDPLADQHVARIEVRRRSDGALLGEAPDPVVGLSLAGVRVPATANNTVPDDTTVEIEIWVTLKDTAPAGRKLQLETVVWHSEGLLTHHKTALLGPAVITTAIGKQPTGVNFSWAPTALEAGVDVTFTPATGIADPSGDIAKAIFRWVFGDGKTAQSTGSAEVKHKFAIGGAFQVTLTVTGEGGLSSSKTLTVDVVGKQPVVDFDLAPDNPAVGQEVAFTSKVTDPATPPLTPYTYAWVFGDDGTSTAQNPTHTYAAAGTYTVVLSVTNSRGEVGRKEKSVTVTATPVNRRPVVSAITPNPANPQAGQAVTFTATATDPDGDPITGYEWKLGDDTAVATDANVKSHTFAASGVFRVQARARDAGGWGEWFGRDVTVLPAGGGIGTRLLDNPARTQCRIQLVLPAGVTEARIQIFDMLGREVRRSDVPGTQFTWDLKDGNGRTIADGLYFFLVTALVDGGTISSEVGKILVVR